MLRKLFRAVFTLCGLLLGYGGATLLLTHSLMRQLLGGDGLGLSKAQAGGLTICSAFLFALIFYNLAPLLSRQGAKLAKDMFNLSVKKIIGSYIAEMGGVDAIVFTAGVGENDRSVRWDVCEHMEYLGIKIDPEKNKFRGRQMDISIDYARVRVLVIPTNEELVIAEDTERLVNEAK